MDTRAEDESQIDHAAVQAAKDEIGGKTGLPWAVEAVERAAHFLSMASVTKAGFTVQKASILPHVVVESPLGKPVEAQPSPAGIAMSALSALIDVPENQGHWRAPSAGAPCTADVVLVNATSALLNHLRPRLTELAAEAQSVIGAAAKDERVAGPVREKLQRQREKRREQAIAKIRKVIAEAELSAEDVSRAWNEHVCQEVLSS